MWRRRDREKAGELTSVEPELSVTIPAGTHFQFKNTGDSDLVVLIVTSPIWPGERKMLRLIGSIFYALWILILLLAIMQQS